MYFCLKREGERERNLIQVGHFMWYMYNRLTDICTYDMCYLHGKSIIQKQKGQESNDTIHIIV